MEVSESQLFHTFLAELKLEAIRNGEEFDLSETDARELFDIVREEFSSVVDGSSGHGDIEGVFSGQVHPHTNNDVDAVKRYEEFLSILEKTDSSPGEEFDLSETVIDDTFHSIGKDIQSGDEIEADSIAEVNDLNHEDLVCFDGRRSTADLDRSSHSASNRIGDGSNHSIGPLETNGQVPIEEGVAALGMATSMDLDINGYSRHSKIEELQSALPGMPEGRLAKIVTAFEETLGYPSILTLVPILRESMPNYITLGWLKGTNRRNAEFVLQKAAEDGLVDSSLLNAMLEVIANAGSINDALEFHATVFDKYMLVSPELLLLIFVMSPWSKTSTHQNLIIRFCRTL